MIAANNVAATNGAAPVLGTALHNRLRGWNELPIFLQHALILFAERDPGRSANVA
jgi:hypothetical protein